MRACNAAIAGVRIKCCAKTHTHTLAALPPQRPHILPPCATIHRKGMSPRPSKRDAKWGKIDTKNEWAKHDEIVCSTFWGKSQSRIKSVCRSGPRKREGDTSRCREQPSCFLFDITNMPHIIWVFTLNRHYWSVETHRPSNPSHSHRVFFVELKLTSHPTAPYRASRYSINEVWWARISIAKWKSNKAGERAGVFVGALLRATCMFRTNAFACVCAWERKTCSRTYTKCMMMALDVLASLSASACAHAMLLKSVHLGEI